MNKHVKDDNIRKVGQAVHNILADDDRAVMEARWGQVWNTTELQEDFSIKGFLAPFVIVERKSDGVRGTMTFSHSPRWYYDFKEGA